MLSGRWDLTSEWVTVSFAELIERRSLLIGDGYRAKNDELAGDGPLFLRSGRVTDGVIAFDGSERLSSDRLVPLGPKMGRPGDTVVTTKGNSTGVVAYVPDNAPSFVYSPHLSFWRALDPTVITAGFVRYWAQSPEFTRQLRAFAGSTDMAPYLSLADQRRLQITLPPPAEQSRIGRVLGALDNKIEHNVRVAQRLDDLGWAWFRHSFGARPIQDGGSYVGEHLVCVLGGTPSRARPEYWRGGAIPWVNSGVANRFRVVEPSEYITDEGLMSSATKLLPAGTTLVAITGATMGKVTRLEIDACTNQSLVGILGSADVPDEFVYYWIRSQVQELLTRQTGAAQQHVSKADVKSLPLLLPRRSELLAFVTLARPALRLSAALLFENMRLTQLRDALLPKLVSGVIRVPGSYDPDDALGTVAEAAGVAVP